MVQQLFSVQLHQDWDVARQDAELATAHTPFQCIEWLSAWYQTLGTTPGTSPLIASIRRLSNNSLAAVFPLIVRSTPHYRIAEFADLDVTDYNAPMLGPGAPVNAAECEVMHDALIAALDGQADIACFGKMPARLGSEPNPLAGLRSCRPSVHNGNVLRTPDDWTTYHRGLAKKFRKELERSWRVFERDGDRVRFVVAQSTPEAFTILTATEQQQRIRIAELDRPYVLDEPRHRDFYRTLIENGHDTGRVVVTALMSGEDEVVASLIGIRDARSYAMLRLSHAGRAWANCSPGRLMIQRTMQHLHGQGLREFDFTIGNYDYKTGFGVERTALVDYTWPLTLRGHVVIVCVRTNERARALVREQPTLYRLGRKIRGLLQRGGQRDDLVTRRRDSSQAAGLAD